MSHRDNKDDVQRYYGQPPSHNHHPSQRSNYDSHHGKSHNCSPPKYKKSHCRKPERGPKGPPGCDGKDGRIGCDGRDGCDGEDGEDGCDGKVGRDGCDGKDGRHGCDGKDGKDGCDGDDGGQGMDGIDGDLGDIGPPGPEGPRGPPGKAGCKHTSTFVLTVSAEGGCDFTKLCDALEAAAVVSGTTAVTIFVLPGKYELCDMKNDREINVVAKGTSLNGVKVSGNGISGGNKTWLGITFAGDESSYTLESSSGHKLKSDTFCKCIFTENFRLVVKNHRMLFRNCFFNYDQLTREKVIIVSGGTGLISVCDSKFFICRLGGLTDVNTFLCFNADTTIEASEILNCHFRIIIDGSDDFYVFNIKNTQLIVFCFVSFHWIKACPEHCVLFGTDTIEDISVKGVRLIVKGCKSIYIRVSGDNGPIIVANLWTNTKEECLTFVGCFFQAAKLVDNFLTASNGLKGCWWMERVTFQATHRKFITWATDVEENNSLKFIIRFCSFTVMPTDPANTPIIDISQTGGAATNSVLIEITHATFRNLAGLVANPAWLRTAVNPTDITYASLERIQVDANMTVGAGVVNATAAGSGP
uniref:Collagen triple helix repeat protein n=1 Tax=Pithovirus LCPAC201 TaxID=2506591 RepID=A0A481Z8I6_9VIRU|nr:MAG: collagen triple helix repeat protein [Pithovirus LCPAC201]